MGQPCLPKSNLVCFYMIIRGPGSSQHLSDWYSFTHFLHGCIFYFITHGVTLWLSVPFITVNYCYLITLSTAVIWEFFENSSCGISRLNQTGADEEYNGDSVVNSFSDSIMCSLGFWTSYLTPWWITLLYAIAEEMLLGIATRENMILGLIQLIFRSKTISDWQKKKNNKRVLDAVWPCVYKLNSLLEKI